LQRAAGKLQGSTGERTLVTAFREISDMCEAISLPRTISDTAKQLFKRVDDEKILRGKARNAIIAACIFIACRSGRVARSFKEIVALTNVPKKQVVACFKVIQQSFETSETGDRSADLEGASARALMTRLSNQLALPSNLQNPAIYVAKRVGEEGLLTGRTPATVAGACLLFATSLFGRTKPPRDIAQVAGIAESTIRQVFKLLLPDKEKLVDSDWFAESRTLRADWDNLGKI